MLPSSPFQVKDAPPNERTGGMYVAPPVPYQSSPKEGVKAFLKRHGRKIWWLHSAYALGLGVTVVAFAQKGFDHARYLAASASAAWVLVLLFFRVFGTGKKRAAAEAYGAVNEGTQKKIGFFAMTYALKNLYQGMLFFLLPFYWKSTTFGSPNTWFVILLGTCALLATLDVVFDRVIFRHRIIASVFHAVALFGCLALAVPALFPETRTLVSLLVSTGITVLAFWTIHFDLAMLKAKRWLALFAFTLLAAVGVAYEARAFIPPVPMYVSHGAVGTLLLPDGRLGMEVSTLHPSAVDKLIAITDVVIPGGKGDHLFHVWRHDGTEVFRVDTTADSNDKGTVRLRSGLTPDQLPKNLLGSWSVDVETEDRQLVGRTTFSVTE